jgi:hypothetical protein
VLRDRGGWVEPKVKMRQSAPDEILTPRSAKIGMVALRGRANLMILWWSSGGGFRE